MSTAAEHTSLVTALPTTHDVTGHGDVTPAASVTRLPQPTEDARRPHGSDVIDLDVARRRRGLETAADPKLSWWTCPDCDLVAGPYDAAEALCLAAVHDQVMHRSRRTAHAGGDEIPNPGPQPSDDTLPSAVSV